MNIRTILLVLVSILLSCKADMDPVSSPDTSSSGGSYQSGNLPDNIYWYSTDNIVPLLPEVFMILKMVIFRVHV